MKLKRIGKKLLIHTTAAALSLSLMVGAFGSFGAGDLGLSGSISASAADAPTSGHGTFQSGGHTYTYEYWTNNKNVEEFSLKSIKVGNRSVSIPSQVYVDGRYHTVNTLGSNFGEYITAETVSMPNTITKINNNVFQSCKVGTLYVSSNVKDIGSYFCSMSLNLENVVYSGTKLESLGNGAFSGIFVRDVYGLKRNAQGAYIFGDWLIRYTGGKTSVFVQELGAGKKITKLGPECFDSGDRQKDQKLISVDLTGVTTIASSAFSTSTGLRTVANANSVKTVSDKLAFSNTLWYQNNVANTNKCIIGEVLLYYHTDGKVIDLSGYDFRNVKRTVNGAIYDCGKATTLKIRSAMESFPDGAFVGSGSGAKKIDTVYVDGRSIVYTNNAQFLPKAIANSLDQFINSPYVKKFTVDKTKGIFNILGIMYYGENGKGGVSGLTAYQKFEIAYKLHEYITTNYFYDFDSNHGGLQPYLDGKSGIVCQDYAELYAYLLESAGVNAEIVSSTTKNSRGEVTYNGNHAWNIVEIGGKWYHCDVCWDSVNYSHGYSNTMYWFMVSDDFMAKEGGAHAKWMLDDLEKDKFYSTEKKLPMCTTLLGDANGDGKRTSEDPEIIQRYLLKDKYACGMIKSSNCDTNFNGTIEMSDVINENKLIPRRSVDPLNGYANHTVKKPS